MASQDCSSKVTALYSDPHNVYQLLSPGLLTRIPLRRLHWASHSGPLRSIESLHIDFLPVGSARSHDAGSIASLQSKIPIIINDDSPRHGANTDGSASTVSHSKERRHQIPGLRQTPYLKILFIRCDDNDIYKTEVRPQVRQWIKDHTTSNQQHPRKIGSQENHDAFEWLVAHVVVPNTAAATQPRLSGKVVEPSPASALDRTSAPRWRGGGSTTIFEKLRVDFNGSTKDAPDRIAQIRIGINDVSYDLLPRVVPALPGIHSAGAQDIETAWLDFIDKLKSLVLASFDCRVLQYEEDIREKDRQRSLPGWNFCTFFVLKEGLARGFENVGLIEDALAGYDELAAGLDATIADHAATGSSISHAGSFLPYTKELRSRVEAIADAKEVDHIQYLSNETPSLESLSEVFFDIAKKPSREQILSNDISIFDFRCYIFSRQLHLLLRLANADPSRRELPLDLEAMNKLGPKGVSESVQMLNLPEDTRTCGVLSEICKRSTYFISLISKIIREDMLVALLHSRKSRQASRAHTESDFQRVFDDITSYFAFALTQKILACTSTRSLPISNLEGTENDALVGPEEIVVSVDVDGHHNSTLVSEPVSSTMLAFSKQSLHERSFIHTSKFLDNIEHVSNPMSSPLEELAARRGALIILLRNLLVDLAKRSGRKTDWTEMSEHPSKPYQESGPNNVNPYSSLADERGRNLASALHINQLKAVISSQEQFLGSYETLTLMTLRHAIIGKQRNLIQACITDLALLLYQQGYYTRAADYFKRVADYYGENGWPKAEQSILVPYARCLKQLERWTAYIQILLTFINRMETLEETTKYRTNSDKDPSHLHSLSVHQVCLVELLDFTKQHNQGVSVSSRAFFKRVVIASNIFYDKGQDSFALKLTLTHRLHISLPFTKVELRVTPLTDEPCKELWLRLDEEVLLGPGSNDIEVRSNVIIPGLYMITGIVMHTGHVTSQYLFDHDMAHLANKHNAFFSGLLKFQIFQQAEGLDAKLSVPRDMHLDHQKSLDIAITTGWNDLIFGEVHLKAKTAGLRLHVSEARVVDGLLNIKAPSTAGVLTISAMGPGSIATLRVPFTLEHEVNDVSLKLEISYTTHKGTFHFATNCSLSVTLPLGVNVQDFFKHGLLFSRFTISSALTKPLRLLRTQLLGSASFDVCSGHLLSKPILIFDRQPASMLYRIATKASRDHDDSRNSSPKMSLILQYACVEEEIYTSLTQAVRQALQSSHLERFVRLVSPIVVSEVRKRMTSYFIEQSAIMESISSSILFDVQWQTHFVGLGYSLQGVDIAREITECLIEWQQSNVITKLKHASLDTDCSNSCCSIVIPVDIPSVAVVHTASLRLSEFQGHATDTKILNEPMSASLQINWTRTWDSNVVIRKGARTRSAFLQFMYEISGPPDTWLIGGRRKGHFEVSTSQRSEGDLQFPIILVPLREGPLPYPTIEIKPASFARSIVSRNDTDVPEDPPIEHLPSCETDYRNASETIHIVSDVCKTTLSLDSVGPHGGAWLLECQPRHSLPF